MNTPFHYLLILLILLKRTVYGIEEFWYSRIVDGKTTTSKIKQEVEDDSGSWEGGEIGSIDDKKPIWNGMLSKNKKNDEPWVGKMICSILYPVH